MAQLTFEWAKANRHNDKLAEFVFLFCPPQDTEETPIPFRGKRDVWLSKLSEAIGKNEGDVIPPPLTQEQLIIQYRSKGMTKQWIADTLGISLNTVKRAYRNN